MYVICSSALYRRRNNYTPLFAYYSYFIFYKFFNDAFFCLHYVVTLSPPCPLFFISVDTPFSAKVTVYTSSSALPAS